MYKRQFQHIAADSVSLAFCETLRCSAEQSERQTLFVVQTGNQPFRHVSYTHLVELVHNSGPMMNKVVFGKEIRCLKDKAMGQYGLGNGDVPDSVLGFCNRQQVIAHLYLMFYR